MEKKIIKALVEGGKASPAPPLGQQLSQHKLDIGKVISVINEKTKEFAGMQVPVEVVVEGESFEVEVGVPPVSSLIKKELNLKKLSKAPFGTYTPKEGEKVEEFSANLGFEQIVKIAKLKQLGSLKKAVKQVLGTCLSCGVTVEGKNPKEIIEEVDSGKWDEKIK